MNCSSIWNIRFTSELSASRPLVYAYGKSNVPRAIDIRGTYYKEYADSKNKSWLIRA
jgi:hypothetical protein